MSVQDKKNNHTVAFVTINNDSNKNDIEQAALAYDSFQGIPSTQASRTRYHDVETNISVRNGFTRDDYEYYRKDEQTPKREKEIISSCMGAYRMIGLIRNVIDLMSDFGCQGVRLTHPNPKIQRFYRGWFKKINGLVVSERFMNNLYRTGNVVVKKNTMKITVSDIKYYQSIGDDEIDIERQKPIRQLKKVIPGRYDFLNPLSINVTGGHLAQFTVNRKYSLKLPSKLLRTLSNPTNEEDKALVSTLPPYIRRAIQESKSSIPLDSDKLCIYHYKKDDWQEWADPMLYSILDDLMVLEKMKLADLAALDGAISQVRLWKLGSLDHEIFPTQEAVNRLADILLSNPGGGAFDLIWGPELDFKETGTNVHQFLGSTKYEPVLNNIYAGLGVPPTLTGASTASGFTNNYISLKTLVQRLEYGRGLLRDFWEKEIEMIQKAMGFRFPAKVSFDRMVLSDESSEKALLIQLADRNIISTETILERFGEIADIEKKKVTKENKDRDRGSMAPKASPWHNPEHDHDLSKIALQNGIVTPSEVGLDLEDKKEGQMSQMEDQREAREKGLEQKRQSINQKPKGEPQQGRPRNSRDSERRKQKEVKPVGASFVDIMLWAKNTQNKVSEILNPIMLEHYNKKNMRSLSSEEFKELEQLKYDVLCLVEPFQEINQQIIHQCVTNRSQSYSHRDIFRESILSFTKSNQRQPTVDETRTIQASSYAILKSKNINF